MKVIVDIKKEYPEWQDICLDRMFSMDGHAFPYVKCFYKTEQKNKKKLKEKTINIKANNCPLCGKKIIQ